MTKEEQQERSRLIKEAIQRICQVKDPDEKIEVFCKEADSLVPVKPYELRQLATGSGFGIVKKGSVRLLKRS